MIKPTIGRVVWYWPAPGENIVGNDGRQPLAGIVTHVWGDECVNLAVFDANGVATNRTSIFLLQDGPRPASGFAEWMPYQKGQAVKTEKIESELDAVRRMASAGTPLI